jgi:putative phosphoribosyl transferase
MIFGQIATRFQLKIKSREVAAIILGEALKEIINENERKNCIVLGILRGGVIMGNIIYEKLGANSFDIVVPRRLCSPHNKELGIGAIMKDGTVYLNTFVIDALGISTEYLEKEMEKQKNEIKRLEELYHLRNNVRVKDRTIVLIDDGAATGATLIVTLRCLRKQNPKKIITAVTVAPQEIVKLLKEEADYVEVITSPKVSHFTYVEQYYHKFDPVSDKDIVQIMEKE